ncbi:hypothetical protein DASC09_041160 [Saccharomycopsis crataegensis]|uniref:NADP-dependent oxidoreductase domain-containing protein n=1 Tax=Saccharomycopsis crataegensis TaxID=43959 RepID=A0AAV5QPZ6_9ASCO|nr:hypothetical protein DASC09_041160 [Saccharomycopsis crataegensis]
MPLVGLGLWKIPTDITAQVVYDAIKIGYRLFDGATEYGNEKQVGQGVKKAIADGLVKREELTIVSKLWNNFHHPDNVKKAFARSLSDLDLEYIDIYYIHFPIAFKFVPFEERYPTGLYCGDGDNFHYEDVPIIETWRALEKIADEGKIKTLGISNFTGSLIQDLLRGARIKPSLLQIEHHAYLQQPRLIEYVQSAGINVVAYSTFGPASFIELNHPKVKEVGALFENATVVEVAKKHNVTPAQVLLRWTTQRGIAVIPKSSKPERLETNLKHEHFDLSEEELKQIAALDISYRFNDPWNWDKIPTFV